MSLDGFTSRCVFHMPNQNKQKEQEMSEKYLPKVGDKIEFKLKIQDRWMKWIDDGSKWSEGEVKYISSDAVVIGAHCGDFPRYICTVEFRPLPLKSPKELAVSAIERVETGWSKSLSESIYEAIAAGKIPGVVLDDGSELRTANVCINNLIKHIPGSGFGRAFVRFRIYINGELAKEDVIEGKITGEFCKTYLLTYKRGPIDISIIETDAEHTLSLSVAWSE